MQAEGIEGRVLRALGADPAQDRQDAVDLLQPVDGNRRGDEFAGDEIARRKAEPGGDLGQDRRASGSACLPGCRIRLSSSTVRSPMADSLSVKAWGSSSISRPPRASCRACTAFSAEGPANSISTPTVRISPLRVVQDRAAGRNRWRSESAGCAIGNLRKRERSERRACSGVNGRRSRAPGSFRRQVGSIGPEVEPLSGPSMLLRAWRIVGGTGSTFPPMR